VRKGSSIQFHELTGIFGAFLAAAFLLVVPKLLFKAAAEEKRRARAATNFMVVDYNLK
jgi:hypothetical protein